jgi:putative phage-type endonuclease
MTYEVIEHLDNITHDQWLDLRSTGIGGSDCAAVFDSSPYTSRLTLWAEKSGRVERDAIGNEAMDWGHLLEDVVAYKYARDYNAAVVKWPVMLRSLGSPFMLANLDFLVMAHDNDNFVKGSVTTWDQLTPPPGDIEAILEVKTTGIVGRGSAHLWEDDGVPEQYWYQGLHYACVTGIEQVRFAALVAGVGLTVRDRTYGIGMRADCIKGETEFWDMVKSGVAPEPDGHKSTSETIEKLYPESDGNSVEADEFMYETYLNFVEAKNQLTTLERETKAMRAHLELAIGSAETMTWQGSPLFTYKSTKDSEAFDLKAFRDAYPDMYAQFVKPKKGYRVFRMKGEA